MSQRQFEGGSPVLPPFDRSPANPGSRGAFTGFLPSTLSQAPQQQPQQQSQPPQPLNQQIPQQNSPFNNQNLADSVQGNHPAQNYAGNQPGYSNPQQNQLQYNNQPQQQAYPQQMPNQGQYDHAPSTSYRDSQILNSPNSSNGPQRLGFDRPPQQPQDTSLRGRIEQEKKRIQLVDKAIAEQRKKMQIGDIEISQSGLNKAKERFRDNELEMAHLSNGYNMLVEENEKNKKKLLQLHKVDFESNSLAGGLEGCEQLIQQNEELRNKYRHGRMELNKKVANKISGIQAKSEQQLENEANFLVYRYQSDEAALKHDVKGYLQYLQESIAVLKAGGNASRRR